MNYTNITYEKLLNDFKARLESDERFKNLTSATIYQMFMEMMCACMDMTNFYMQRTAEEGFIDTAKLDSSVIKHGHNLGYNPRRRCPAKCDLQIVLKGPLPVNLAAGDEIHFNQDVVDLVYSGRHYILDAGYSYKFSKEDLAGRGSTSWRKVLNFAVPSENVQYLPLQGRQMYNSSNLTKISCFQAERKTVEILGNANLNKLGKNGQFYDINDTTFSNWYGRRDPFAYYKDNYQAKLGWTKVGIGKTEEEAFADENIFDIENNSIYLSEKVQQLETIPVEPLKICLMETNPDKTVRLRFGNNAALTHNGLVKANENIYVRYLSTTGKEANQTGTTGCEMQLNCNLYLQHAGEIIDVTNNVKFIINSDIHSGEEFETKENIKINAPAYFASRNKLITKQDFVSYFRGLSSPFQVQTALVFGQQEIEDETNRIYKYIQNYVFYSIIGHMYTKQAGNYCPRNVLTSKDNIDEPFSIYADTYLDHIADYVKMVKSFEGFYNQQYDDEPQEQWLKNLRIIRENCQNKMEINSRILSLPPVVQYYDLVGKVKVKPLTKLQDYKTEVENKIYEYLDNRNGSTQKIYKSDLIKFFTDMDDTLAANVDIKVSDIVKSSAIKYSWGNPNITGVTTSYGRFSMGQNPNLESAKNYGPSITIQNQTIGTKNWINSINVTLRDLYNSEVDPRNFDNKRMTIKMINRYYTDKSLKTLTSKTETYIIKVNGITIDEDYFTICPQDIIKFNDLYEGTTEIFIDVPSENDFYSTSSFSTNKTYEYKLSKSEITNVMTLLNKWINNGTIIEEADRAIPLPYSVYGNETITHAETYFRMGYQQNQYENTISEKAFWMYFIPQIIEKYYKKHISSKTSMESEWWKALSCLILDLYALVKPAFCDNILDDNNNIVNFSMPNEVAVIRINVSYGYDMVG